MTAQALLDKVNAAIAAILDGGTVQRFSIRGKDITLYTLSELMALRVELQHEAAEESAGASVVYARLRPES